MINYQNFFSNMNNRDSLVSKVEAWPSKAFVTFHKPLIWGQL